MRWTRLCVELALLVGSARAQSTAGLRLWPFQEDMEGEGQAFNSFIGRGGQTRVVAVSALERRDADGDATSDTAMPATPDLMSAPRSSAPGGGSESTLREYQAFEIKDYDKLLDTLSVSGSVSIAAYGQSADMAGSYFSKESFEKSSFTYLIRINVKHQPTTRNTYKFQPIDVLSPEEAPLAYGDTYIKKFIYGGAYYARVSIVAQSKDNVHEVEAAAKAAFSGWVAGGEVTAEMKKGMRTLSNHSSIEINKMSLGELRHKSGDVPRTTGDQIATILADLKSESDAFYQDAIKHRSKLYALLDGYETTEGFYKQHYFKPMDYKAATRMSRQVLQKFMEFQSCAELIRRTPVQSFKGDNATARQATRQALESRVTGRIEDIYRWVDSVTRNASLASVLPEGDPWAFREELTANIDDRRMWLYNNGGKYHVWDQLHAEQKPHALWAAQVYRAPFPDTVRLVCGESHHWGINRKDGRAACRMGGDLPAGYVRWFEAWVHRRPVAGATDGGLVQVARTPFDNGAAVYGHNQLRRADPVEGDYLLFYPLAATRLREDSCNGGSCQRYG